MSNACLDPRRLSPGGLPAALLAAFRRRRDWIVAAGLVALAGLALFPLARAGLSGADDVLDTIYRVFALGAAWQRGLFYPRWSPDLAYGYGAPLFQYYPPLAAYLSGGLYAAGLGVIASVKAGYFLAVLGGALGMYCYSRVLFGARPAALVAAIAYGFAPYQLANVYLRGAGAESLGLALLPWIFWAYHQLYFRGGAARHLGATLALALLLLAHNSLSLFGLPALLAYLALLAARWPARDRALLCLASVLLALGLTAFFWLPAIAERSYVNIDALTHGVYDPVRHLVSLRQVVQGSLWFDYEAALRYRWGLLPSILTLLAVLVLPRQRAALRPLLGFALALVLGGLALQIVQAQPFWERVPLVRFIQFPWRLLGLVGFGSAILIGSLVETVCRTRLARVPTALPALLAALLGCALLWSALPGAWATYVAGLEHGGFQDGDIGYRDMYQRGRLGFELFSDYQPVWVSQAMADIPGACPLPASARPAPLPGDYRAQVLKAGRVGITVRVESSQGSSLIAHQFYFPGWQARVDGQPARAYPSGPRGLLTVAVPPGAHTVDVDFGDTPLRRGANAASGLAVLACLWIGGSSLLRRLRRRAALPLAALAALAIVAWLAWPALTAPVVAQSGVSLANGLRLVGYQLDRATYRPGETAKVTLYWLATRPVSADDKAFVHLRDPGDTRALAQHDGRPGYGATPTNCIEAGEIVADEHPLTLPGDLADGSYPLTAGMYDAETVQNVAISPSSWTLPGDRISLGAIQVRR